jgi:hypothetical protein
MTSLRLKERKAFSWKPTGKRLLGRTRRGWEDDDDDGDVNITVTVVTAIIIVITIVIILDKKRTRCLRI